MLPLLRGLCCSCCSSVAALLQLLQLACREVLPLQPHAERGLRRHVVERASAVRHRLRLTRAAHLHDVAAIPVREREEEIGLVLPMLADFLYKIASVFALLYQERRRRYVSYSQCWHIYIASVLALLYQESK